MHLGKRRCGEQAVKPKSLMEKTTFVHELEEGNVSVVQTPERKICFQNLFFKQ